MIAPNLLALKVGDLVTIGYTTIRGLSQYSGPVVYRGVYGDQRRFTSATQLLELDVEAEDNLGRNLRSLKGRTARRINDASKKVEIFAYPIKTEARK